MCLTKWILLEALTLVTLKTLSILQVLKDFLERIHNLITLINLKLQIKGALSGQRQFLETEYPLKMMKNTFYFTLKALFVLKIFKIWFWLFGHVEKRLN